MVHLAAATAHRHRRWPWAVLLLAAGIVLLTAELLRVGLAHRTDLFLNQATFLMLLAPIPAATFVLIAPRIWEEAARSYAEARVSPLWFLLVLAVLWLPDRVIESHMLALAAAQTGVASAIVFLHRRWPWSRAAELDMATGPAAARHAARSAVASTRSCCVPGRRGILSHPPG